jgi:hypothetical protein
MTNAPMIRNSVGREALAVSTAAVTLAAVPATARHAMIQGVGADTRVTFDGTTPTATVGLLLLDGIHLTLMDQGSDFSSALAAAQFIRNAAVDSLLQVEYFD